MRQKGERVGRVVMEVRAHVDTKNAQVGTMMMVNVTRHDVGPGPIMIRPVHKRPLGTYEREEEGGREREGVDSGSLLCAYELFRIVHGMQRKLSWSNTRSRLKVALTRFPVESEPNPHLHRRNCCFRARLDTRVQRDGWSYSTVLAIEQSPLPLRLVRSPEKPPC